MNQPAHPDGGTLLNPRPAPRRVAPRGLLVSVGAHALVLLAVLAARSGTARVIVPEPPGTAAGNVVLTYFSPGSLPHASAHAPVTPTPARVPTMTAPQAPSPAKTSDAQLTTSSGPGASAESGLGSGDLHIALPTFSPAPRPSLSSLPSGTAGDVILDAVIDAQGHITQLTLLRGLGPAIDQSVIATVQQWVYAPATRDGKPVASGQELHFHYERG
jgi:protein TonB